MGEFQDVAHKLARIGGTTVEYIEGHAGVAINGMLVTAEELVKLIEVLKEAAPLVGAVLADTPA